LKSLNNLSRFPSNENFAYYTYIWYDKKKLFTVSRYLLSVSMKYGVTFFNGYLAEFVYQRAKNK